jgi:hypothetical protein
MSDPDVRPVNETGPREADWMREGTANTVLGRR